MFSKSLNHPRRLASFSNLLWRPRVVYGSAREWAEATQAEGSLKPLEPSAGLAEDGEWLLELAGGKVIGDARLVTSSEDGVIGQLQSLHGIEKPAAHWTVGQKRLRRTIHLPGISFLLGVGAGENYYHWLFESLPRLELLRRAGLSIHDIDHFVLNEAPLPFHLQTLDLLGIPLSKRTYCSKRRVLECETLLVPPMPTAKPFQVAHWICEFLRKSYLSAGSTDETGARVYLSRRRSPKRRLANEPDVEALFTRYGFRIVQPEALSFEEQLRLFAGAAVVAGPHGAGFANLVFAAPGTRVIELFHPGHHIKLYENLAAELGMPYQSVIGTAPNEQAAALGEKLGPYSVVLDEIKQLLDH